MNTTRTQGELLFEQYLTSQRITFEFEKEHPGKSKRPDYTLPWKEKTCVFDVKDFDAPAGAFSSFRYFDPYTRVREKVNQAREKFKEYKDFCCGLVLRNLGNPFVMLEEFDIMLGVMYGDAGFTFPVNTQTGVGDASKLKRAFLGCGKMIRPNWSKPQNTSISAIITLAAIRPHHRLLLEMIRADRTREIEDCEAELKRTVPNYDPELTVPRVIVWHNAFARIPFPDDLFCGPYDSHVGVAGTEQRPTFRGDKLPSGIDL